MTVFLLGEDPVHRAARGFPEMTMWDENHWGVESNMI